MSSVGARQVGEFGRSRHMIRSVRNPLDKATIVSIFPKAIDEVKPTLQERYKIPAGSYTDPAIVVVGPSSWWRDVDYEQPLLEIPVSAVQIAHSVIADYCNGLLGAALDSAMPGLFFVPGEVEKEKILNEYKFKLADIKNKQDNWYRILVKLADSLWARSNGNPLVIWDEMRLAARELGLEKVWIKDFQMAEMVKCFACGSLRNPEFPICSVCKNVDMSHPRANEIRIAAG